MLRELQSALSSAFRESDVDGVASQRVLQGLRPVGRASARQGLRVYQRALRGAVERALTEIFPVCAELVGERCFRSIARVHADRHDARHPDIGRIGDDLPELLVALDFLASVPYLADVARLELALHRAADAPEPSRLEDPDRVAESLAGAPDRWRLTLPPSATLIESPHPVHAIWRAHQDDDAADDLWQRAATAGGDRLIVLRSARGLAIEPVEAGLWSLLIAIGSRAPVSSLLRGGAAHDAGPVSALLRDDPEDHGPMLTAIALLFERGWVTGVEPVADRPCASGPGRVATSAGVGA